MYKLTRMIALFLLAATIATFAACSSDTTDAGGTTTSASESTTISTDPTSPSDMRPDVDGLDLGGADFGMLYYSNLLTYSWTGIPTDMNPTEETGDILNDAVYNRNRSVEERVNIVINEYPQKGHQAVMEALQQDVMSGDGVYDIAFQSIAEIAPLTSGGLIRDISATGAQVEAPWFDQKSVEELAVNGKLYFATTDISYLDKLATIVTFFNKSIAENYSMDDFYQKVSDGEWTYDYMLECAEQISADINGDGAMTKEDNYGILCQNDGQYYLLHSAGVKVGANNGGEMVFSMAEEKSINVLSDIFALMNSDLYFNCHTHGVDIAGAIKMFVENRGLFLIRPIQSVFSMREMEADFGIIPVPKYYEDDDEYHTPTNVYPGIIMCVPTNAKNTNYIGQLIDLLAYESSQTVMPVFYDMVLDSKLSRDDITSQMLDIVFDSRVYDLGFIWDIGGFRSFLGTASFNSTESVASTIAGMEERAALEVQEMYEVLS